MRKSNKRSNRLRNEIQSIQINKSCPIGYTGNNLKRVFYGDVNRMRKQKVFTIFNDNDTVYGYLFDMTRLEAQKTVEKINEETKEHHYYMDGYIE